ncbi:hypothetical protein BGZ99_008670, partial [Dissophora globulifera]
LSASETVDLTDAHAGPVDALFNTSTDLLSEDKSIEDLQVTSALTKTPISDIQVRASSSGSSTLTTLDLSNNTIESNGAQALSEALKINSTLTTLVLEYNLIGHNGRRALSEACKNNSTLADLRY